MDNVGLGCPHMVVDKRGHGETAIYVCQDCKNEIGAMGSLFDVPPAPPSRSDHFDGADYDRDLDELRLTGQLFEVWKVATNRISNGGWFTVDYIVQRTGFPANSVQAQLRNLRKPRYGAYLVERRRVTESGLSEYRVGEKGAGKPATVSCLNCARLERIIVEMSKETK